MASSLGLAAGAAVERLAGGVRGARALALQTELGDHPGVPATVALDDRPEVAAWQLCAIAPLGPVDHQRLLEVPDVQSRLRLLAELATAAADLLGYRLSGGDSG